MSNWVRNMSNSMSNWVSNMSNRMGNMGNWMSSYSSILSFSFIGYISNITIIIIGMIVNMLDATIGKVDRVGSFHNTSSIIGFSLVKGSTRVIISNSISVTVGRRLSKVRLCISGGVSNIWGMVNNRGMVDDRGMGNSYWVSNCMSNLMSKIMSNETRGCRNNRDKG